MTFDIESSESWWTNDERCILSRISMHLQHFRTAHLTVVTKVREHLPTAEVTVTCWGGGGKSPKLGQAEGEH